MKDHKIFKIFNKDLVFIHIPKTGGTSIVEFLSKNLGIVNRTDKLPDLNKYNFFASIREPEDRFLSYYRWLKGKDMDEFSKWLVKNRPSQNDIIKDINILYYVRFENLIEDLNEVLNNKLGFDFEFNSFPHLLKTKKTDEKITEDIRNRIYNWEKEIIDKFYNRR